MKARVSRQELDSKEKEDKRSLNRFLVIKMAHQARLNTVWERNGPFTDTTKMTDDTNPHNGTV